MLTEVRWQKEQELMESVFPQFRPFSKPSIFGFKGRLLGPKSGLSYRVVIEGDPATYPQCPPSVYMHPRIGVCWIGVEGNRRRLCMDRNWQPARSTFANTLLAVIRYLDEHDSETGSPSARARERCELFSPEQESNPLLDDSSVGRLYSLVNYRP